MTDELLFAEASNIALIGMGSERRGGGRGATTHLRANEDPLGHWMLVEAIVDLAKRYAGQPRLEI